MTCLECVLCAQQLEAAARGVWEGGQGLELQRPLNSKIKCKKKSGKETLNVV